MQQVLECRVGNIPRVLRGEEVEEVAREAVGAFPVEGVAGVGVDEKF